MSHKLCQECDRCTAIIFKPRIVTIVHISYEDINGKDVQLRFTASRTHRGSYDPEIEVKHMQP
jgi:hypothetical protein